MADQCRTVEDVEMRTFGEKRNGERVPVETCNGHRAAITVAASPMAAFVPVGVAMAEVGDDETVTLLFARNDRPERPSIGQLCLCAAPSIATMSLVAGSAASRPYSSRIPSELPRRTGGSLAFVRSVGCD